MKSTKIIFSFILMMIGNTVMASTTKTNLSVNTRVDIKYAYCKIKANEVPGVNNRDAVLRGSPAGTTATNSLLALENGSNTFTIEIASPEWFSKNKQEENKNSFNRNAYCTAEIRFVDYNEGKVGTLGNLIVKISDDGIPEAYLNNEIDQSVIKKTNKEYTQKVTNNKLRDVPENEYPNGMTIYQFDKEIVINGIPEWKWVTSEPYTGTQQQIDELKMAYENLWMEFNNKNLDGVKKSLAIALDAWAVSSDSTPDKIFNSHQFDEVFKRKNAKMIPIDWNNFEVISFNKGRLVRMVYKEDPDLSPLSMRYTSINGVKGIYTFSPIFSLIDGKFVPVI
ncbi:hypothetical protein REJ26_001758 [Providencia stuartii]|uniref:hypothetical protein n=1 Tax=Providencia TaxID=586 RepID=UPI0027FC4AAF|nr:hypothetical protein [Providencia sp. 2023EL-00965]ELR5299998.1 hypothetical protein [Providencia stuartii]MDW7588987.1 hypothetical protein [Providencia sp. 2023EL-00965]